ncbi:hypothetical protein DXB41_16360 [Segatella copri]|nr:hypothetical protein DXB41_16360 [Segatella copri]
MTNDKSNKELDKSTLRIPTFNMILRKILVVNAYGDKSLRDEILLQDELFYNTVSQLNFSKDSSEVRQLLSYLNAIVTIEWGDGETESVKWKVDDWGQVKHSYQSPGYY